MKYGPNAIRLRYDSGPDTVTGSAVFVPGSAGYPDLCERIRQAGPPRIVAKLFNGWLLEWPPIFPDAGEAPQYRLGDPWHNRGDSRALVAVELADGK